MIHPTQADVGRLVNYSRADGIRERGRISSIREEVDGSFSVWVRFNFSSTGQLTPVENLEWD